MTFPYKKVKVNPRLSYFQTLLGWCPICCPPILRAGDPLDPRRIFKRVYTIYGLGSHLCYVTETRRPNFCNFYPLRLHEKFCFDWLSRFWGEDVCIFPVWVYVKLSGTIYDPRVTISNDLWKGLDTKYQRLGPSSFRQEDFFLCFVYEPM